MPKAVRKSDIPPGMTLRRTLRGHVGQINEIAFSPDGRRIASGSGVRKVRVWEVGTGEEQLRLEGHKGGVWSVAFSEGGDRVVSGGDDGTVRVWEAETGEAQLSLKGHVGLVWSVAFCEGADRIVSGGDEGTVRVWEADTGRALRVLQGHTDAVTGITFSSTGVLLASKSDDGTVRLWNAESGDAVAILDEPVSPGNIANIAFSPAGPVLATLGEENRAIRIWDLDLDLLLGAPPVEKSVHYTTAKIVLVGDATVGKSALAHRLVHGEFKVQLSTHGQRFWIFDQLCSEREDGTRCEAVLWDLAGQPDYRIMHSLFVDDADLAVVMFDAADRSDPLKGAEYWLTMLARRQGKTHPRSILVAGRLDVGQPALGREEIEAFAREHGVTGGYVCTSAATREGLDDLLERMRAQIPWDEFETTVTTETFNRIKDFILDLKQRLSEDPEAGRIVVSPEELRTQLESKYPDWEFSDEEMLQAVRLLEKHGFAAVLRRSSGEDRILLAPERLNNLAHSIVQAARSNPRGLGALDEGALLRGEHDFRELADLDKDERETVLEAVTARFIDHVVCFRAAHPDGTLLVFPGLINMNKPEAGEAAVTEDASYTISGVVENVYASLVVLLGYTNTFSRRNQWRNQAQYQVGEEVCGFRLAEQREGELDFVLYYGEGVTSATRLLFEGLFETLLRTHRVKIAKYPSVTCSACDYRQERAEVVRRVRGKQGRLFCSNCGQQITLPVAAEEVSVAPEQRVRVTEEQREVVRRREYEKALTYVKAPLVRESGGATEPVSCFISYAWGVPDHERWVRMRLAPDLRSAGIDVILDVWHNAEIGGDIQRFVSRIESSDYVVPVGTPAYRQKWDHPAEEQGSWAAEEVRLIQQRLKQAGAGKSGVLPVLIDCEEESALPPLLHGKVHGDFRDSNAYFPNLFDLVLTLFQIDFADLAVADLRQRLREGSYGRRGVLPGDRT